MHKPAELSSAARAGWSGVFGLLAVTGATLMLVACATTANYEKALNSWVGSNVNALVDSWGYPAASFKAPDGNTVYVYQRGGNFKLPTSYQTTSSVYDYGNAAYGSATTNVYGGETLTFWCRTYFEVDSSQTIVSWRWQGNACKSR